MITSDPGNLAIFLDICGKSSIKKISRICIQWAGLNLNRASPSDIAGT